MASNSVRQHLIRRYFTGLARRLEATLADPREAQRQALVRLSNRMGGSVLSQRFGFHKVSTPASARRLPILDYPAIEESSRLVRRLGPAAAGIFGRSRALAIAQTSGTTGEPKLLPINRDYVSAYHRFTLTMNASFFLATDDWSAMDGGKTLLLTARPLVGVSEGGLPECFISGFMASRVPLWYRSRILPSRKLLYLSSWEEKMDAVLEEARGENVRAIVSIPALALSFTERALEKTGARQLREIWPGFRGLLSGGTPLGDGLRQRLEKLWGATASDPLLYWDMYAATEAQIGHTFRPDWPGMVFNPFENFYQFLEEGRGPLLQLHELERGKRYVILLTTPGGLINYRTGDWVEIVSVNPLLFRVSGRDKEELSLATEKINVSQLREAMAQVCGRAGIAIENFVLWGEVGDSMRLVCGVFGEAGAGDPIAELLDEELGRVNPSYRELRGKGMVFQALRVVRLPEGVFREYLRRNLDRGQFKPKLLFATEQEFRKEYGWKG